MAAHRTRNPCPTSSPGQASFSNIVFYLASKLELWIRIRIKFFRIRNLDPDPGDKIEEKMLKIIIAIFFINLKWEQKPNCRFCDKFFYKLKVILCKAGSRSALRKSAGSGTARYECGFPALLRTVFFFFTFKTLKPALF